MFLCRCKFIHTGERDIFRKQKENIKKMRRKKNKKRTKYQVETEAKFIIKENEEETRRTKYIHTCRQDEHLFDYILVCFGPFSLFLLFFCFYVTAPRSQLEWGWEDFVLRHLNIYVLKSSRWNRIYMGMRGKCRFLNRISDLLSFK